MQELKLPRLYAVAKTGKIKYWEVEVTEDTHGIATMLIRHAAGLTSKPTERMEIFKIGKNIGRSNETSPFEQACSEAQSRWRKQQDKGYTESVSAGNEVKTNTLGLPMPMLAYPVEKLKGELLTSFFTQTKLNGHRCMAHRNGDEVILYSRQGKQITTMSHIEDALLNLMPDGEIWDGELYIHGMPLQEIGSLIKKRQEGSERVEYHVYDCVMDAPFQVRRDHLIDVFYSKSTYYSSSPVYWVSAYETEWEELSGLLEDYQDIGYEGVMIRHGDTPYEAGFRSRSLLKVKSFQDSEFIVLDIVQGKPVHKEDGRVLEVAVLVCDGFRVMAPGNEDEKHAIWENREEYIGRLVTVKYYDTTKDGVPFHPIALQFRDDI